MKRHWPFRGRCHLVFFVCLAGLAVDISSVTALNFDVKIGTPLMLKLPPNSQHSLTVNNVGSWLTHLILQVHTHYNNMTLSETEAPTYGTSVVGHNLGLVSILKEETRRKRWYLKIGRHRSNITTLIHLTGLSDEDPVPGGCNMVFPLENDPNSLVSFKKYVTKFIYQWSNLGYDRPPDVKIPSCESKLRKLLSYDVYIKHLPHGDYSEESYFDSLEKMLTSNRARIYGTHIASQSNQPDTKSTFSITSRVGEGFIVTIVVSQPDGGSAIYVPIATYNCNMSDPVRNCEITYDVSGKVLTAFALLFGLFLSFLGHRFFRTELLVFGLMASALISTILFMRFTDWDIGVILGVSAAIGVVGGALWVVLWCCLMAPVLSVSIPALVGGYLLASVLFATPFGNLQVWSNPLNYGLAFTFATVLFPGLLLAFTRTLNILACTFVGSYLILLLPDYYLYGSMQYLLVSSIHKAADDTYLSAIGTLPYQTTEVVLTVVWILLFLGASLFQFVRERKRPKFPSSRREPEYQVRPTIPISQHPTIPIPQPVSESPSPPVIYPPLPVNERTPLLPPTYSPPLDARAPYHPPPYGPSVNQRAPHDPPIYGPPANERHAVLQPPNSSSPPVRPTAPPPYNEN